MTSVHDRHGHAIHPFRGIGIPPFPKLYEGHFLRLFLIAMIAGIDGFHRQTQIPSLQIVAHPHSRHDRYSPLKSALSLGAARFFGLADGSLADGRLAAGMSCKTPSSTNGKCCARQVLRTANPVDGYWWTADPQGLLPAGLAACKACCLQGCGTKGETGTERLAGKAQKALRHQGVRRIFSRARGEHHGKL